MINVWFQFVSNAGVMKLGLMGGGKLALVLNQTSTTSRAQTLVQLFNPKSQNLTLGSMF